MARGPKNEGPGSRLDDEPTDPIEKAIITLRVQRRVVEDFIASAKADAIEKHASEAHVRRIEEEGQRQLETIDEEIRNLRGKAN